MSEQVGKNTLNGERLRGFVERLERIDEQKQGLSDDAKFVIAEARSEGFSPAGINYVRKVRRMKPHDRQEAETVRDLYLHALGMDVEPPLFRQLGTLMQDAAARDHVVEAFKALVPANGEVIVKMGDTPLRLYRDKDGVARVEDWIDPAKAATHAAQQRVSTLPPAVKKDVPACTADEAEALGHAAGHDNKPVIDNPFPFDDARRPRWDLGWRKATGNDGMGPK